MENAIFTEPDDQSAWVYHQFLLCWAAEEVQTAGSEEAVQWLAAVLQQQLELVRGLWEIEENCTWVMNCLLNTIDTLTKPLLASSLQPHEAQALLTERTIILEKLILVDPNHKQRYSYLLLQHD